MARGKKVYNLEQRELLERAEMKCASSIRDKAELNAWMRRQADEKMRRSYEERGVALRAALAAGVNKSDLMSALGSKNWYTFKEALEFGAELERSEQAVAEARQAAQPFEVLETLAWNDIPHVRKLLATGADGAAAVGATRLVVSRTDESVKGWVTSMVWGSGRKFGFVEDKFGPGGWWEGRGAYRIRDDGHAAVSWDELAERQTGQVRELVLWVAENITDWGE